MRVRCLRGFRDLKSGVFRGVGDAFEVDEGRYKELNGAGYGQLVEPVAERKRQGAKSEVPAEPEQANEPEGATAESELAAETTPRPSRRRARSQE